MKTVEITKQYIYILNICLISMTQKPVVYVYKIKN